MQDGPGIRHGFRDCTTWQKLKDLQATLRVGDREIHVPYLPKFI
jgi:hypothetical protein